MSQSADQVNGNPGVSNSGPELSVPGSSMDHGYSFQKPPEETDNLPRNLLLCEEAVNQIFQYENFLGETVLSNKEMYLLKLEKILLDLAAIPDLTSGVYYHLAINKSGVNLARYFEHGTYEGAMNNLFHSKELVELHPYCLFTQTDVEKRTAVVGERARSVGEKRKKTPTAQPKNRTGARYKDLLIGSNGSKWCLTGLLENFLTKAEKEGVSIHSLVVAVDRQTGFRASPHDTFLLVKGQSEQSVSIRLRDHKINKKQPIMINLRKNHVKMKLKEQFEFLSAVPNLHWHSLDYRVNYVQTLSTAANNPRHHPCSIRNRFIYFMVKGKVDEAIGGLVKEYDKLVDSSCAKRRRIESEESEVEAEPPLVMPDEETGAPSSPVFLLDSNEQMPNQEVLETVEIESYDTHQDYFCVETGLWQFGGLSDHQPKDESSLEARRNVVQRLTLTDAFYDRDSSGYYLGVVLKPPYQQDCQCGAGFLPVEKVDMVNLQEQYSDPVILYMRHGAAKARVFQRRCINGLCITKYTGEEDCIYFWSQDTAVAEEVLRDFERQVFQQTTFSSFCDQMTHVYLSGSESSDLEFMSQETFTDCFFGWLSLKKIDFRADVDPYCKYNPKFLACSGIPVGKAVDMSRVEPIEKAELPDTRVSHRTKYDRCFLSYCKNKPMEIVQHARKHLRYLADKYMNNCLRMEADDEAIMTENLLSVCADDAREMLQMFSEQPDNIESDLLLSLAQLMKLLSYDTALEAYIPHANAHKVIAILQNFTDLEDLKTLSCIEVYLVASFAQSSIHFHVVQAFLLRLAHRVVNMHKSDRKTDAAAALTGTYNPSTGVAYNFTPTGEQIRKLRPFQEKKTCTFDDIPEEACSKNLTSSSHGSSSICLWFCPIHGHSYGFHLIPDSESPKDPFFSLIKYKPAPPSHVFYDFACSLSEYSLNREPGYFRNIRFWRDIFQSQTHICGDGFTSSRVEGLNVDSQIWEELKVYMQRIMYVTTQLSQAQVCFWIQYAMYKWNAKCKEQCEKRNREAEDAEVNLQ